MSHLKRKIETNHSDPSVTRLRYSIMRLTCAASIRDVVDHHLSFSALYGKTNLKHVHVALLYRRGKLLAVATNFVGSRNRGCGYDHRTIHAERAVLKKVGDTDKLSGATLIVIRIAKGTRATVNSEPCHTCRCHLEKCIKQYGLRGVYYSVG